MVLVHKYNYVAYCHNLIFTSFSKYFPKIQKIVKTNKHVFNVFQPFTCTFVVLNYFSLIDIFLKKSNSKKNVLYIFVSILYFLNTFLIKLMLTLFVKYIYIYIERENQKP